MKRTSMWYFVAAVVFSASFAICAEPVKYVVKDIKVKVLDNLGSDASDVLSFCNLTVGSVLSDDVISKDVRSLLETKRFSYAGSEVEKMDDDGVRVWYLVRRRYRFQEPLIIKGSDALSQGKISKLSDLKSGDYIDESVLADSASKVRDEYLKRYYPDVKIVTGILPIEGSADAANVSFTIEEGERQKIKDFVFTGNTSIEADKLKASFGRYEWYDPRGWFTSPPISSQDMEDARMLAKKVYQDNGFLDVEIGQPKRVNIGKENVNISFDVSEGDKYTVDSVAVRNVKYFTESAVLAAVQEKLKPDDVAGQAAIDAAEKAVYDYYGQNGYVDTQIRVIKDSIPGKPGRIAVTYEVKEGELAYVRSIIIRGNSRTKDKVIRREVRMDPGSTLNTVQIERNERRLRNLGYFKDVVHYYENRDPESKQRDLVYEVTEQRTGNFMIGAGLSSVDNVVGFLEISQSNFDILNWPTFTGGGQKARLGVEVGTRRQTAEVSWTEPWFLDRPVALTVELYRRMRWYDEYDEIRTGGSVGLSYAMKEYDLFGLHLGGRVGARYTLEMVEMDDVDKSPWYYDPRGEINSTPDRWENRYFRYQEDKYGDNLNSIVRFYWSDDTRNNPFIPTRGYQTILFGDVSEGGIGDNEFYKVGANYKRWFEMPWYHHVFSIRGRFETVDAYHGDLPIYEHLFLGGPRSIRGVEYRDVGPKVYRGNGRKKHAPMGGKTLAMASAEYTIPIFKALRFATFIDAGSLSDDEFDPEFSDISVTAGVGLRIDIPHFPIRLDFATPIHDDDKYTDEEVFSFLIGFE